MAEPTEPESLEETQARLAAVGDPSPDLEVPRPDPYAPAPEPPTRRAPRPTVFVVLALVLALGIGGVVAFVLLFGRDTAADQEVWVTYPAVAGADTDDILEQPSLEATELAADLLLTEYRTEPHRRARPRVEPDPRPVQPARCRTGTGASPCSGTSRPGPGRDR